MEIVDKIKGTGVTVDNLSKATGIPVARIYKWFRGKAMPKYADAIKLEDFLNETVGPPIKKSADLGEQIGTMEERLIRLEGYTTVLFDTAVASLSQATSRPSALVRAELQEAVTMVLKHLMEQSQNKQS